MRLPDLLTAALVLAGLALVSAFLIEREVLEGPAIAVDGDTLQMAGGRIRLAGMDAPELRQECHRDRRSWACGEAARRALDEMLARGPAKCAVGSTDPYGRLVARCLVAGTDLADRLVRDGLAVAYRGRDYAGAEAEAQAARRGIWAGSFQRPADYRAEHPRAP